MITAKQRMLELERQLGKLYTDLNILITDLHHAREMAQRKESELLLLRREVSLHGEDVTMSSVLDRNPYLNNHTTWQE